MKEHNVILEYDWKDIHNYCMKNMEEYGKKVKKIIKQYCKDPETFSLRVYNELSLCIWENKKFRKDDLDMVYDLMNNLTINKPCKIPENKEIIFLNKVNEIREKIIAGFKNDLISKFERDLPSDLKKELYLNFTFKFLT